MIYASRGHAYLVCPRLLDLDERHGQHPSKWPPCRHGRQCPRRHEHEAQLLDPEGHSVVDFFWLAGCDELLPEHVAPCACGEQLVWADLDDPHHPDQLTTP